MMVNSRATRVHTPRHNMGTNHGPFSGFAVALVLLLTCTTVGGENLTQMLMSRGNVLCYECSSWTNPLCDDPFNFTLSRKKGPPIEKCDGCCVKLVQHIGTPYASIRRTCTEKLQINLFVVDHVCMVEGGGHGHMCFCEEDLCNAAPPSSLLPSPFLLLAALLSPLLLLHHQSILNQYHHHHHHHHHHHNYNYDHNNHQITTSSSNSSSASSSAFSSSSLFPSLSSSSSSFPPLSSPSPSPPPSSSSSSISYLLPSSSISSSL